MSHNRLELTGLEDFRAALRKLPDDLKTEAGVIVDAHAEEARRSIAAGYPEHTGNLRQHVSLKRDGSRFGLAVQVKASARHAHLFEFGTRRRTTANGANRGVMPKASEAEAFIPKAIRARARMVKALIDLVRRAGFEVHE